MKKTVSLGIVQEVRRAPNFCKTSECTERGFVLKLSGQTILFSDVLHHIQKCQYGLGVSVARLRGDVPDDKSAWQNRIVEHLREHPTAMNCPAACVSLCCTDTLSGGKYTRDWFIAVIDNALGNEETFEEFYLAETLHGASAYDLLAKPDSPVHSLNAKSSEARRALIHELAGLCEPRLEVEIVGDTPFFDMFARDDGRLLEVFFMSHTFGKGTHAVLSLSPTQGFWLVEFSRPGAGEGFPLTLPRTQQFVEAAPAPCGIPVVGLSPEGDARAERTGVYAPIEKAFAETIGVSWAGLCSVRRQLRPEWVVVAGRSRNEVSNGILKLF